MLHVICLVVDYTLIIITLNDHSSKFIPLSKYSCYQEPTSYIATNFFLRKHVLLIKFSEMIPNQKISDQFGIKVHDVSILHI